MKKQKVKTNLSFGERLKMIKRLKAEFPGWTKKEIRKALNFRLKQIAEQRNG